MSRTHRSPGPRLEELRVELREKERFMSHGYQSFQYLLKALKSSGHSQCTMGWTKDAVVYRCRTCQINDSSAICAICFHQGDHKFHDFIMYHSESGGCCDCGDRDAWREDGFCKIHRVSNQKPRHLSAKRYELTQKTVCWALEKLSISVHIIWVRRLKDQKAALKNEICVAGLYMQWVKKVCSVDVLRNLLSVLVTRKFLDGSQFEKNARGRKAPLEILLKTLGSMPEELTEGATTLFLQMLYNGWFKSQFTEELMKHYPRMVDDVVGKVLKHSQHEGVITECKALHSTLDRVMVQLFNVAPTVMELIKNNNLLWKFTSVFDRVLKMSLNQRGTVNVEHEAIRHKVYLRPQGDLRLIVSHSPVAVYVLNERLDVFEEILKLVTYLQWMNPYTRFGSVDFENDNAWTLAIQLEMNTMAIVFQLIARCYSARAECCETVKQALVEAGSRTLKSLHSYLSEDTQKLTKSSMSLHIPLHRVLSAILSKLILLSWCDNKEGFLSSLKIDFTEEEVLSLLELPLRIAAWMVQIRANQWQHVSEEFFQLELIYRGSFWPDKSWDMDLLLLQFCAVAKEKMEHAIVLRMAECFDLRELVTTPSTTPSTGKKMFMVSPSYIQDFLRIILLVVRDRRNTGMDEEESLRYNVIQWLCVGDQTYSQLCQALSVFPVDYAKLSLILAEVADFRQPKVQEQGYFQLKPEWWTKFDPLFAQSYLNELEDAQERAGHVGKQQFYWRIGSPHEALPPYNRLTNLLHTQECHQLLWNVLNHVKILVEDNKTSTAGEALGVTALQMMEISLRDRLQYQPSSAAPQPSGLHPNDILVNIKLSPSTYPGMVVGGSSTWKLGSSSMYDLLQEFQILTNAHRLADYAQYTLHLLHSSFPIYFGAEFRGSKLKKSPEYQASIVEDERQRLKKERQAALLAKFSAQQKGFIEQHEDHEDDDNEHRHDDAGPTEGSHAVMYDSDSPGCCDCTNGGAWKEDWPNMSHTSIMVNYFQLILESIKEVQKFISQGSLDDWNSEKKFLRINKLQCEYLASELEEIQTYLELQSHVSRHIKHGVTMKHLYHMVKKAEMLVMECCSEKWLLKAVALMDSKENFVEIVLELRWWKNMVHVAILEIQETRTSSLLLQLQDADKAYEDFLNQRLHILEKELLEDKQMLVTKLEQVTSGWLTDDTLELQNYLLHRLGRTGQSRDCATHSPFSWRPSQFKNGVQVNLDADALGYDNTATVVKVRWLMGQEFVVKLFTRGVQEKDAMVAKASEAIILSKIQHPHVVQLMCYWDIKNLKTCLLMEKMAGDISRLMAQQTTKETSSPLPFSPCKQSIHPFSLLEAMQIMLQVAKAMCFLHSKEVAHRDLKCRNILWKREPFDNHLYVKLADFGEAKTNVRNSTTDQQQTWLVGTTGWRAPELSGKHMLTHKRYPLMVDVFSFGMTFFEVLTGQGPFQAELRMNVQIRIDRGERPDLPKTCPPFLAFLIHSCWDGNPKARPTFPQICRMLLHGQNLILGMTWYDKDVKSKLFSYTSLDGIKKELKVVPVADRLK